MIRKFLNLALVLFVIPFGMSQDLPSYVPTDGLVAYYPFNGNANDASGNGNDGVNTGAVLTIDRHGNSDSAFYFSGSSCSTRIDADVDMSSILSSMSVSMWVNRNGNGCYNPRLFDFYDGGNNSNDWGEVWFNGANLFNLSGSGYSDNDKWYNITIIINYSENSRKYFIDGNLVNNIPNTKTLPLAGDLSIGRMNHPAYDAFNGIIDDFGIWNRALTEQEIQNLYNSSTGDIILNGVVSAEGNQIKNVADPTDTQDAATKNYVDNNINSFSGSYNDLTDKPTIFNGSLIGDLTGNVTGDVTGNVTSDILKLNTLTQTEIDAITPEEGMVLYNQSKKKIQIYSTTSTSLANTEFTGQYVPDENYYRVEGHQTFIAPFTGTIYGISLYLKKKEECCNTMLSFEGNSIYIDFSDSTFQNASLNSSFWHEFTFNNPVSVTFGQSYSFYVDSMIFDLGVNFAYSDGEFDIFTPNNFAEGVDLMFLVNYTVDPNSPTTLSWINLN